MSRENLRKAVFLLQVQLFRVGCFECGGSADERDSQFPPHFVRPEFFSGRRDGRDQQRREEGEREQKLIVREGNEKHLGDDRRDAAPAPACSTATTATTTTDVDVVAAAAAAASTFY